MFKKLTVNVFCKYQMPWKRRRCDRRRARRMAPVRSPYFAPVPPTEHLDPFGYDYVMPPMITNIVRHVTLCTSRFNVYTPNLTLLRYTPLNMQIAPLHISRVCRYILKTRD